MNTSRPLALVTGATSGIGQAFARRLAGKGYDLIAVGRNKERLDALQAEFSDRRICTLVADLGTDVGLEAVADTCRQEPISMLVNNAGVAYYMGFAQLPPEKASEILQLKVITPTMLAHAVVPGMLARQEGTIINVAGMLAFGAAAPLGSAPGRAVYVATLAHLVALSEALHEELNSLGVRIQVLCPGIVATEFHERQGIDLGALPRMSVEDVVSASLRGISLGEVVCTPGVDRADLLDAVLRAKLTAFGGQSAQLAERYRQLG